MLELRHPKSADAELHVGCECGNSPAHEGFYRCDPEGRPLSHGTLVCCERCGKITDCETGRIFGQRSYILPPSDDGL